MVSIRACVALIIVCATLPLRAAVDRALVEKWLEQQSAFQSWSADLVQTRSLKALSQPLKTEGHVWFAQPKFFRWELGNPPQTIAVRQPDQVLLLYPRLKRVEKYDFKTGGPWKHALELLEAGFPRNYAEIETKFKVLNGQQTNDLYVISMEPKQAQAKRMIPQLRIGFSTKTFALTFTELSLADGSSLRNDFSKPQVNPVIPDDIFKPQIPENYKVIEGALQNAR